MLLSKYASLSGMPVTSLNFVSSPPSPPLPSRNDPFIRILIRLNLRLAQRLLSGPAAAPTDQRGAPSPAWALQGLNRPSWPLEKRGKPGRGGGGDGRDVGEIWGRTAPGLRLPERLWEEGGQPGAATEARGGVLTCNWTNPPIAPAHIRKGGARGLERRERIDTVVQIGPALSPRGTCGSRPQPGSLSAPFPSPGAAAAAEPSSQKSQAKKTAAEGRRSPGGQGAPPPPKDRGK